MNEKTESKPLTEYGKLLQSPQWSKIRTRIIRRDGYKCRNCGSGFNLEVHHRQYHILYKIGAFRKPWEYDERNLVTLCTACHHTGHNKFRIPVYNI
jgi:5-methylcytosine-specific restriction endonuclease McrA